MGADEEFLFFNQDFLKCMPSTPLKFLTRLYFGLQNQPKSSVQKLGDTISWLSIRRTESGSLPETDSDNSQDFLNTYKVS